MPKLCYEAGRLVAVEHAVFEGDPLEGDSPLIGAVRLTFESLAVVFRAVPEDDSISVN